MEIVFGVWGEGEGESRERGLKWLERGHSLGNDEAAVKAWWIAIYTVLLWALSKAGA